MWHSENHSEASVNDFHEHLETQSAAQGSVIHVSDKMSVSSKQSKLSAPINRIVAELEEEEAKKAADEEEGKKAAERAEALKMLEEFEQECRNEQAGEEAAINHAKEDEKRFEHQVSLHIANFKTCMKRRSFQNRNI
jgi:hypothetical protein